MCGWCLDLSGSVQEKVSMPFDAFDQKLGVVLQRVLLKGEGIVHNHGHQHQLLNELQCSWYCQYS